jgi:hypothetical protein
MKVAKMIGGKLLLAAVRGDSLVPKRGQHLPCIAKKQMQRKLQPHERCHELKDASLDTRVAQKRKPSRFSPHLVHRCYGLEVALQEHNAPAAAGADATGGFFTGARAAACENNCSASAA